MDGNVTNQKILHKVSNFCPLSPYDNCSNGQANTSKHYPFLLSYNPQNLSYQENISQLDGNNSLLQNSANSSLNTSVTSTPTETSLMNSSWFSQSDCASNDTTLPYSIPTQVNNRPQKATLSRLPPVRQVIKRSNKSVEALHYPAISV